MDKIFLLALFAITMSSANIQKDELYLNYVAAVKNPSTFQYYLVIKYKNLNTNEVREICTVGDFLSGALHHEYNIDYDNPGAKKVLSIALKNKRRYFEFKNDNAIKNLGGETYTIKELKQLEQKVNFDSITAHVKKTKRWSVGLRRKQLIMYAHALFNRGILTGQNGCVGGSLEYVDRNNPNY